MFYFSRYNYISTNFQILLKKSNDSRNSNIKGSATSNCLACPIILNIRKIIGKRKIILNTNSFAFLQTDKQMLNRYG